MYLSVVFLESNLWKKLYKISNLIYNYIRITQEIYSTPKDRFQRVDINKYL